MNKPLRARTLAAITGLLLLTGVGSGTPTDGPTSQTPSPTASSPAPTAEPTPIANPFHVELTDADDGARAELAVGGTLVVTLPLDPATGMVWYLREGAWEHLSLRCGHPITNDAETTQTLTFRAVATATAPLILELRTPETAMDPAATFTATVQIVDSPDPAPPAGTPTSVPLVRAESGTTVQLANHGQLTVVLSGQPRLGYTWSLVDYPRDLITVYCPMSLSPPGTTLDEPPPEASWESVFTFDAIRTGTAETVLEYRHEDAPDAAPEKSFLVTVEIL